MTLLLSKDGIDFWETEDNDENAKIAEQKGYKRYLELTKNGHDIYRVPADENIQSAFDKGYKTVGISKFLGEDKMEPMSTDIGDFSARAYSQLLSPVAKAIDTVDSYIGAPLRAGGKAFQQGGDFPTVVKAVGNQFGEDTTKAPTTADLYARAGVPNENNINWPTVKNPFSPTARFQNEPTSVAKLLGGATGAILDPLNYIPGEKIAAYLKKGVKKAGPSAARKLAHTFTSVRPEDFDYYVQNHARLKDLKSQGTEGMRHQILGDVKAIDDDLLKTDDAILAEKTKLKNQADEYKKSLDPKNLVEPDDVDSFHAALENDKVVQGQLSSQADAELGKVPITAPKEGILEFIDEELAKYPGRTPAEMSDKNTLQFIRDALQNGYTDYLDGGQLRDWMQVVRKQATFSRNKGEYTDSLDRSLQAITKKVSNSLKKTVPKYKELMDEMSGRIKATEQVQPEFTGQDQSKGLMTLIKTQSKDPGQREIVMRKLKEYAANNKYPELGEYANKLEHARKMREELELQGYDAPFDRTKQNIADLEQQRAATAEAADSIRAFTPTGTENIINNLGMYHGGKDFAEDQLKALEKLYPERNYRQRFRDEGVLGSFEKERPNGSRAVRLFGGVGGTMGGAIGLATTGDPMIAAAGAGVGSGVGGAIGAGVDKFGGQLTRAGIDQGLGLIDSYRTIANKINNPSPAMAPYVNTLKQAMTLGPKGLLVSHHLLYNNDPEYRKAFSEGE